ncbi:hypothetical protein FIBSPDRAFT_889687 [Athelia psychrophila]|uniref:Uncharacterized protein n=1 Tax=Athelia psychrophila TaxID=1759441 RepID=A0A166LTE6_9AGAM|nr:hypothetical protein FIBSPDRAFT_889687 [Fibularhizoctonia sp. CBS 109695]
MTDKLKLVDLGEMYMAMTRKRASVSSTQGASTGALGETRPPRVVVGKGLCCARVWLKSGGNFAPQTLYMPTGRPPVAEPVSILFDNGKKKLSSIIDTITHNHCITCDLYSTTVNPRKEENANLIMEHRESEKCKRITYKAAKEAAKRRNLDLFTKQCKYMVYIKCKSLWREIAAGLEPDARAAQPLSHDHPGWPGFTERSGACPLARQEFEVKFARSLWPESGASNATTAHP